MSSSSSILNRRNLHFLLQIYLRLRTQAARIIPHKTIISPYVNLEKIVLVAFWATLNGVTVRHTHSLIAFWGQVRLVSGQTFLPVRHPVTFGTASMCLTHLSHWFPPVQNNKTEQPRWCEKSLQFDMQIGCLYIIIYMPTTHRCFNLSGWGPVLWKFPIYIYIYICMYNYFLTRQNNTVSLYRLIPSYPTKVGTAVSSVAAQPQNPLVFQSDCKDFLPWPWESYCTNQTCILSEPLHYLACWAIISARAAREPAGSVWKGMQRMEKVTCSFGAHWFSLISCDGSCLFQEPHCLTQLGQCNYKEKHFPSIFLLQPWRSCILMPTHTHTHTLRV